MASLKQSVKASSVLESLVALTILLAVFGFAISFFVQVSLNSKSLLQVKAEGMLDRYMQSTKIKSEYDDEITTLQEFSIKKTVVKSGKDGSIMRIYYSVYDSNGKFLFERKEIIKDEH